MYEYKSVSSKHWSVEHLKRCWLNWSTLNWIRTLRTIVTMASAREHDGKNKIFFVHKNNKKPMNIKLSLSHFDDKGV